MTIVNQQYRKLNPSGSQPREISEVVNNLMDGKSNNTGTFTLANSNATSTTIYDERIGYNSVILFSPITFNGANNSVPYGSFQNTANQTLAAANTDYTIVLNTTDVADGIYISSNKIYFRNAGTYNIQFSLQFANPDTQIHTALVWLAKNGTAIDGTGSKYDVTAKHGTVDGYLIAVANFFVTVSAGDYIELKISVSNTLLYLEAYTAASPVPAIPSSVVTATLASPIESPYVSSRSKGSAVISHYANSYSDKTYSYIVVG